MKCKVKCPECGAAYRVDTDRMGGRASMVRCQACSHRWRLDLEDLLPEPASIQAPASAPAVSPELPETVTCPHCAGTIRLAQLLDGGKEKPRILLVDDKAFFRDYAREILGDGYDYISAANTTEALEQAEQGAPHLIILDLRLENGPRDGHHILANRTNKDVPVLILTGERNFNIHSEDWSELEKLGARDIVEKGINIKEMLAVKVRRLLGES